MVSEARASGKESVRRRHLPRNSVEFLGGAIKFHGGAFPGEVLWGNRFGLLPRWRFVSSVHRRRRRRPPTISTSAERRIRSAATAAARRRSLPTVETIYCV